jgi:hypothetical protein
MGWTAEGLEFESRCGQDLCPLYVVQTGSVDCPAFYPMGVSGIKWQEREADLSSPTSAEVKNTWVYTSTPPYFFMA